MANTGKPSGRTPLTGSRNPHFGPEFTKKLYENQNKLPYDPDWDPEPITKKQEKEFQKRNRKADDARQRETGQRDKDGKVKPKPPRLIRISSMAKGGGFGGGAGGLPENK